MGRFQIGDRVVLTQEAIERNQVYANSYWKDFTFEVVEEYPNWGYDGHSAYELVFGNYDGEPGCLIDEDDLQGEYE